MYPRGFRNMLLSLAAACLLLGAEAATAGLSTDRIVNADRSWSSTTITSPYFSTSSGNELLLAFIAADSRILGQRVLSVSGGGLNWSLARQANGQLGAAEVWKAFATSPLTSVRVKATLAQSAAVTMTVVAFSGAIDIGSSASASARTGAPAVGLTTTRDNSWVWAVGSDWDHAIARTVPPDQVMVHQYLATVGDTYWIQRQASLTPLAGTQVFMNDTAPTADRYNLVAVEVLASDGTLPPPAETYELWGSVSGATGVTVVLSGAGSARTTTDSYGRYSFAALPAGAYTVAPSLAGFTFAPPSQTVVIESADVGNVDFVASELQTACTAGMICGDTFVHMNTGSIGAQATAATLTAGSVGVNSSTWDVDGGFKIGPFQHALKCPAQIAGVFYAADYSRQSLAVDAGRTNVSAYLPAPANTYKVIVKGFVTFGATPSSSGTRMFDLWRMNGSRTGGLVILQLHNGIGADYVVQIETNPGGRTTRSNSITITPGATYFLVLSADYSSGGGPAQLTLWDPQTWTQLGATLTAAQTHGETMAGIDFGNKEYGTSSGQSFYFHNLIVDWTQQDLSLGPGTCSP